MAAAKLLMLHLQAFDYRKGTQVPYRNLDYDALAAWLELILALDPAGQYPLMAAARTYAEVPDPARSRKMLELVHREYLADPDRRWPWLAHAAVLAKHRLKDMALALRYAETLERHTTTEDAPLWVRQMVPFILADMGELEQARIMIGGLIASGQVRDARDAEMLERRLRMIEERLAAEAAGAPGQPPPLRAHPRPLALEQRSRRSPGTLQSGIEVCTLSQLRRFWRESDKISRKRRDFRHEWRFPAGPDVA
ncbi:MAG: hypothetical protein M5U08_03705 [Burkholderiales bacterium]|nr:hypothetical protein [Burkholderiales bacterium]